MALAMDELREVLLVWRRVDAADRGGSAAVAAASGHTAAEVGRTWNSCTGRVALGVELGL